MCLRRSEGEMTPRADRLQFLQLVRVLGDEVTDLAGYYDFFGYAGYRIESTALPTGQVRDPYSRTDVSPVPSVEASYQARDPQGH